MGSNNCCVYTNRIKTMSLLYDAYRNDILLIRKKRIKQDTQIGDLCKYDAYLLD